MVIKSWGNNEELEILAEKQRNKEIVEGVVRSVREKMKVPTNVDGEVKLTEQDTLIVALPGGVTGYCPASDFREREFRSLDQFVTHIEPFIISRLDLENQVAYLSGIDASNQLKEELWDRIDELNANNRLEEEVFTGKITGYNQQKGIIYVRISGHDTYMYRSEWDWNERAVVDAERGQQIDVKIVLFDKELDAIRVSRKQAMVDPYEILDRLELGQIVAGKVVEVHPIHGLFVEIENDVVLKAGKISSLPEPSVGDFVSCRIQRIDSKNRRGRVVILSYPRGRRRDTVKDIGHFLFE